MRVLQCVCVYVETAQRLRRRRPQSVSSKPRSEPTTIPSNRERVQNLLSFPEHKHRPSDDLHSTPSPAPIIFPTAALNSTTTDRQNPMLDAPEPIVLPSMPTILCLPAELLFHILSFVTNFQNRHPTSPHPLNSLASTCRHLHAVIESYTRSLLKQYANFTLLRGVKGFCYRRKWLAETCQFCKRKSERRAIFYRNLTCCRLCDKQYFPKMVCHASKQRIEMGSEIPAGSALT